MTFSAGRLIIGILSCQNHASRQQAVRRTWMAPQVTAYFLVGRPGEPQVVGDTLFLDCADTYEETPRKVLAFLGFCERFLQFDALFKCDDDTYVAVDRLLAAGFWRGSDYAGRLCSQHGLDRFYHFGKTSRPLPPYLGHYLGGYADGGYGYSLSRRAVRAILDFDLAYAGGEIYEDKMIGDVLRLQGIQITDVEMGRAREAPAPGNRWITAHPMTPGQMCDIHRQLHAGFA